VNKTILLIVAFFSSCVLVSCVGSSCDPPRHLDCENADLRRQEFAGEDLSGADLSGANLISANLRGSDLSGADLNGANLRGADLGGANLIGANLRGSDLSGAEFSGAVLSFADLRFADLSHSNLTGADLRFADLFGTDLSFTNLCGAHLESTNINKAKLKDAFLGGAYLSDAINSSGCRRLYLGDDIISSPSPDEMLLANSEWDKFYKTLKRCSDAAETNCFQNAGTGILMGSPIAATLQCIYMKYSNGQYGCKWEIKFYRFSSYKWSYSDLVYSLQSEMFDGALFAEMTGDTNSELYFSVMNISFAEAEVLSFKEGEWSRATFDGQSVLYMGYFNSKTGKMESGVSLDMGKPCDYRRWTKLVYLWDETEFKAVSGFDENENPISLSKALECN
jgi:uncharacterized protein YjbI with pentapeptide repeats